MSDAALRFAALLDRLAPPRLALAVSGGPDSLALLDLAEAWAAPRQVPLAVLTVDHGLRPAAAGEAAAVEALALAQGHRAAILHWQGEKPAGDLAAAARAARYTLLTDWCRRHGFGHLATAHSLDDQAETLLMRLHRGSGLDGLAAIEAVTERDGIVLLRPLLETTKAALCARVAARGWAAVDDPSNRDPARLRSRVRAMIAALDLDSGRLAETARRLARDRAVIDGLVADLAAAAVGFDGWGNATVDRAALATAPPPVAERLLGRLVAGLGGAAFPPRHQRTERLLARLCGDSRLVATLGGCRIALNRGGTRVDIGREAAAVAPPLALAAGGEGVWDGRFRVAAGPQAVEIGALGALVPAGLPRLPHWRRAALPAIFRDGTLVAVPLMAVGDQDAARLSWLEPRLSSMSRAQPVVYRPARLI